MLLSTPNTLFQKLFNPALNKIIPPLCLLCFKEITRSHHICSTCWRDLQFIGDPLCVKCGLPLNFDPVVLGMHDDMICESCFHEEPKYDSARAVFLYNDAAKKLILPYKHNNQIERTRFFAHLLYETGRDVWKQADIITPIPLHWIRLIKRQYNQSALLAKALAKETSVPYVPTLLRRIRNTAPQGSQSKAERLSNVQGAFAVSKRYTGQLTGKTILIVDDVLTSGATANACSEILKSAGATKILVLTIARVALK